jgi:phage regulator Rha-like protein
MDKNLVIIKEDELFVGTWNMSQGFQSDHRHIKRLIDKYKSEFEEFGKIATDSLPFKGNESKRKRGGQVLQYWLNEGHAIYLTTLLQNNEIVRKFKRHLSSEFLKQRKILNQIIIQRQNTDWAQKREQGKIERRLETDAIKEFVEYAKTQGSKSADKYYMIISKMENASLISLEFLEQKYPNIRDIVDGFALTALQMADRIVAQALREGMKKKIPYKDIYVLARDRVEIFALSIGKTPLRLYLKETKEIQAQ